VFRVTVRCGLVVLLAWTSSAWTSSAGAILVPLSASELVRVKPILAEVGQIDQQVNKLSSSFGCPLSSIPAGRIQKTVGRDPQRRVRFLGYVYPSISLRAQRVRFYYYSRSGQLIWMQYYTSGKSLLGFEQTEIHEVYFGRSEPLIKTFRSGVLGALLEPTAALEPNPARASERTPAQDCVVLYG